MEQSTIYGSLLLALFLGIIFAIVHDLWGGNYKEPSREVVVNEYVPA